MTTRRSSARSSARNRPTGFISWSEETFERLINSDPEPLQPRMRVSHSMLVNVLAREGNPVAHVSRLLTDNHHEPKDQRRLQKHALVLARELISSGVVERLPVPEASGRRHALTIDLQRDFALNQPLAPFALAVMETLDPESETYAKDLVSVIEAILENPRQVLWAQESKARGEAVAAMKLDGIEYEERNGAPRRGQLAQAARRPARGHPGRLPADPTPGSQPRPSRRSRSCARCSNRA